MPMIAKSEDPAAYTVEKTSDDDEIIAHALRILAARVASRTVVCLASPNAVRSYLQLKLAAQEHESFYVITLDAQNRVIGIDELFRGTLTQTSVYPREIVKHCLKHNAAAVIFAHNHPSGEPLPSRADELLTSNLKTALGFVDVRVLDHLIVGGADVLSFAEKGLI
jgi:DNA repair protein RadC